MGREVRNHTATENCNLSGGVHSISSVESSLPRIFYRLMVVPGDVTHYYSALTSWQLPYQSIRNENSTVWWMTLSLPWSLPALSCAAPIGPHGPCTFVSDLPYPPCNAENNCRWESSLALCGRAAVVERAASFFEKRCFDLVLETCPEWREDDLYRPPLLSSKSLALVICIPPDWRLPQNCCERGTIAQITEKKVTRISQTLWVARSQVLSVVRCVRGIAIIWPIATKGTLPWVSSILLTMARSARKSFEASRGIRLTSISRTGEA